MKEKALPKQLLSLKKKMSWSWERMCREIHRVMNPNGVASPGRLARQPPHRLLTPTVA